jgi:hypothetical protein
MRMNMPISKKRIARDWSRVHRLGRRSTQELSGEERRTADAVGALRAGQGDGYDAFGKDLLGRLQSDRREMRDIDDRGDCRDSERTRRIYMAAAVMRAGVIGMVANR